MNTTTPKNEICSANAKSFVRWKIACEWRLSTADFARAWRLPVAIFVLTAYSDTLSAREQPTLCKLRQDLPFFLDTRDDIRWECQINLSGKRKMKSWEFIFRLFCRFGGCCGRERRSSTCTSFFFRGEWKLSAQQIFRFGNFQIFFRLSLYNGNWRSFSVLFQTKKFSVSLPSCVLDFLAFTAHNEGEM